MCGIVGFLDTSINRPEEVLRRMADSISHRGPDDQGYWHDQDTGIALGHRRLSILDLSPAGHQPMHSMSGRYVVVFNGEIYNYRVIRSELEGLLQRKWRGHSDTEVMLEAFETWGIEDAVKRLTGMFAIAVWDRKKQMLHLVRDRIGEKPLYYGIFEGTLLFGSELKVFKMHPAFKTRIDKESLALYMRYCYVPAPLTIYKGIYKLTPGTIIKFGRDMAQNHRSVPTSYWSALGIAQQGLREPFNGTDAEAASLLKKLLSSVIGEQMVADVPLGAFLSGGIDSSMVVALMQAQSSKPIRTFTIGFDDKKYDEAADAKEVANHLGTEHTELYVSADDALKVIPLMPKIYDEPFGDSSQVPTFLVSQMTRRHVTVSLSGDAGDELFGGYNRYVWGRKIWNGVGWIPCFIRRAVAPSLTILSSSSWDKVYDFLAPVMPSQFKQRIVGDKIHKLAGMLGARSFPDMYHKQVSTWKDISKVMPSTIDTDNSSIRNSQYLDTKDFIQQMMYLDLVNYLPDDILVKVDRAAMSVSLETRMPFLDHRIVDFAWRLPLSMKIRDGQGKWILHQLLYEYIPKKMIERPKMGFGIPIDAWLCGPLRGWAEGLLDENRLRREGFFDPKPIRILWNEHLSGRRSWQHQLWNILMFEAWLENQDL